MLTVAWLVAGLSVTTDGGGIGVLGFIVFLLWAVWALAISILLFRPQQAVAAP